VPLQKFGAVVIVKNEVIFLSKKIGDVYWTLLKIMVPALIIVKILDSFGGTQLLSQMLSPVMNFVGLPDSMGIVWATAMLINIYTAMALFFSQAISEPLTVAQITVLASMILMSHSLVVEGAISKASGVAWWYTLTLRIGAGLLIGFLLNLIYTETNSLQDMNQVLWQPELSGDDLLSWIVIQLKTLVLAFLIISGLVILMRLLEVLGVEKWLHWLLTPFLKLLGIDKSAANITVIGFTLGLSFGGGLLIAEARSGNISKRTVFLSMSFLCLCHSLVEDTLLMMLLGADLSGILWMRLLLTFIIIGSFARIFFKVEQSN
jgi:hypothetical protein